MKPRLAIALLALALSGCGTVTEPLTSVPEPIRMTPMHRSSHWRTVRAEYVHAVPYCEICGGTERLEVHHNIRFAVAPQLELCRTNLVTLCRPHGKGCHWQVGHGGLSWADGPDVRSIIGWTTSTPGYKVWQWRQERENE